jgi:hypothetical protein
MGIFSGEFGREIVFLNPGNFQNGEGLRVPRSKSAPQPAASPREALRRYQLTEEEYRCWEGAFEQHGLAGLRRQLHRRSQDAGHPVP